ncbi:MAG: DNA-formamidopyrimidine glycosylase, partial [Candidatus Paceibacterota bacterium]
MPELPEVETIRRQLQGAVVGKTIRRVEILEPNMFGGDPKIIVGQRIIGVGRAAKVLRIFLGNGSAILAHFKLNGQFFLDSGNQNFDTRFTRVILHFDDGTKLLFNDSRKFAWMKVVEDFKEEPSGAIEPFKDNFTLENLAAVLAKTSRAVKVVLMDQTKIGGIGNIYANESLFKAGIYPFRPANTLKSAEIKKLHQAISEILQKSIDCKGSSGKDEWYRQLNGQIGCYQEH